MTPTHTPGPWTVEHHGGPWHIFGANDERVGTYAPSLPSSTEALFATAQANARLIAAAPDLLQGAHAAWHALQSMLAVREGIPDESLKGIAAFLHRAIAKAVGPS